MAGFPLTNCVDEYCPVTAVAPGVSKLTAGVAHPAPDASPARINFRSVADWL